MSYYMSQYQTRHVDLILYQTVMLFVKLANWIANFEVQFSSDNFKVCTFPYRQYHHLLHHILTWAREPEVCRYAQATCSVACA